MRSTAILPIAMAAAVLGVLLLAWLDERRSSEEAARDLAGEQHAIATVLVANEAEKRNAVEVPGERLVFLARRDVQGLVGRDGTVVANAPLRDAALAGVPGAIVDRDAAEALGLPRRMAVAGMQRTSVGDAFVVVASAHRQRDRMQRGNLRLVLTVTVAAALIFGFGGLAVVRDRRRVQLEARVAAEALSRERDELLVRSQRMTAMAALGMGIAHEIATPLSVIVARLEQVRGLAGPPEAERPLRIIDEQVSRIREVIAGILRLARGEAPTFALVRPSELLGAVVGLVGHRFARAGIDLRVTDATAGEVRVDPPLFEQLLVNLLLNAGAAHGVTAVQLGAKDTDGLTTFFVEDDGDGIPEADRDRVMAAFFTTKERGSGLGLAIVKEIADHHGATVDITPPARGPRGTRVAVTLGKRSG